MVIIVWKGMNKAWGFEAILHSFCVGDVHAELVFVYGWQALLVTNNVQKLVLVDKGGNLKSQQKSICQNLCSTFLTNVLLNRN